MSLIIVYNQNYKLQKQPNLKPTAWNLLSTTTAAYAWGTPKRENETEDVYVDKLSEIWKEYHGGYTKVSSAVIRINGLIITFVPVGLWRERSMCPPRWMCWEDWGSSWTWRTLSMTEAASAGCSWRGRASPRWGTWWTSWGQGEYLAKNEESKYAFCAENDLL